MAHRYQDLEDRVINFTLRAIEVSEVLPPKNKAANKIADNLARASVGLALIYGEVQDAESKADFIHKMKLCLKEFRECLMCFKLIYRKPFINPVSRLDNIMKENEELISIFVASIKTARSKKEDEK
jgi:four helix bundle protein